MKGIKKIGMIFPGQGSQFLGMGKDFYDSERIVQELFEEASNCLEQNFVRLCFASSENELRQTINAQTSIFLLSSSIYTVLNKKYEIKPEVVAGHSSGEYAAVYAGGGTTFPDALYLLKKRALFMEEATKSQQGGMLAVIGLPKEDLESICKKYDSSTNDKVAQVVNYNSSQQLVVSGTLPELEMIKADVKAAGGKAITLNVSGAFHSRLMQEPQDAFNLYMGKVDFKDLDVNWISNFNASNVQSSQDIKEHLSKQISSPVLWAQSMDKFQDCDLILEVGPGDKLTKIFKREYPSKKVMSISSLEQMYDVLTLLDKKIIKDDFVQDEKIKIKETAAE